MRSKFELGVTTTIKEKEKIALNMPLVHLLISWAEEQKYTFEFSVDQNFSNNEPYTSSVVLYVFLLFAMAILFFIIISAPS